MKRIHNNFSLKDRRRELRRNATLQEQKMWFYLRNRKLGGFKFNRQHSIGRFIVDFYCPEKKIIIEIDGSSHEQNKSYDLERDLRLMNLDFIILRISNNAVDNDIQKVLDEILEILKNPLPTGRG